MNYFLTLSILTITVLAQRRSMDYEPRRHIKYFHALLEIYMPINPFFSHLVPPDSGHSQCTSKMGPFCTFVNGRSVMEQRLNLPKQMHEDIVELQTEYKTFAALMREFIRKQMKIQSIQTPRKMVVRAHFEAWNLNQNKINFYSRLDNIWGGNKKHPSLFYEQ